MSDVTASLIIIAAVLIGVPTCLALWAAPRVVRGMAFEHNRSAKGRKL